MTNEVAARRRIIRRPRLTSMLDASSARIRLLTAPAGYGKTTLAREWLSDPKRKDAWYRGGPSSVDVAALAAGISEAVGTIIPEAGKRMRERLRATGHAEQDVEILAELFVEDLQAWPTDAWLAVDDYQLAMASRASEAFVDLLTRNAPTQMLIMSRARPTWATARRILYGEVSEIDRGSLAMNDEEVQEAVGIDDRELSSLLDKAHGWPAVIGLVQLGASNLSLRKTVPEQLYAYFAQELYESLPIKHQKPLGRMSFASHFDREFARTVLGRAADEVLESGVQKGILNQTDPDCFDFHPLLAEFLGDRAFDSFAEKQDAAAGVGYAFLAADRWDEAVEIAIDFQVADLLIATLEASLFSLLDSGRLSTIGRWLEAGVKLKSDSPTLDLAEAEVAFRRGNYPRAEAMAEQAALRFGPENTLSSRAYFRAGHSALLGSREEASVAHFRSARCAARDGRDRREALFGLYSAVSELEWPEAGDILAELEAGDHDSPDDRLRALAAKLTSALRSGGIEVALASASSASLAVEKSESPIIITSFLHTLSNASSAAGRYEQALHVAEDLLSHGRKHRLDFVQPYGLLDRALAHLGLRSFAHANHDVEVASRLAPNDVHHQGNAATLTCRFLLATGRATLAAEAAELSFLDEKPSAALQAELHAYRALALACTQEVENALTELDQAEGRSNNTLVVRVLAPAVRSICAANSQDCHEHARVAWCTASATGDIDTLICTYRAYPALLGRFAMVAEPDRLAGVLVRANDAKMAQRFGIAIPRQPRVESHLTARESEVMDLVAAGLSNLEVAQRLFITESTVKVHTRHIYEKLGVRGRSEAVAKWLARP